MNQIQFNILVTLIIVFSIVPWTIAYFLFKTFKRKFKNRSLLYEDQKINIIQELNKTLIVLKKRNVGGTFIIDLFNDVSPYINNSQLLDAKLSANLLINIFEGHNTPLHDGAIVIKNGRIKYASSYITKLSSQNFLNKKLGTRHRSALGLSEHTRAIIIVLSEESGIVSIFKKGELNTINLKDFTNYMSTIWKD